VHHSFKSSITGKSIEKADIAQLEEFLRSTYPDLDIDQRLAEVATTVDRFLIYQMLLLPLEKVEQSRRYHPEGDALYHSLQVFDLVRNERPYDEEFLLAALLHDVGKGIDTLDHVRAGVDALEGTIADRTGWLITHHMEAHQVLDRTIGLRARRRLRQHESFEELPLLAECDRDGRIAGAPASSLEEAVGFSWNINRGFAATGYRSPSATFIVAAASTVRLTDRTLANGFLIVTEKPSIPAEWKETRATSRISQDRSKGRRSKASHREVPVDETSSKTPKTPPVANSTKNRSPASGLRAFA
jgi:hypothetical protein